MHDTTTHTLPAAPGVGFKAKHFADLMADPGPVAWIEVHAENYMGAGGRPLAQLRALAEHLPVSVHGVGLSIGGHEPLDKAHLARLAHLLDWAKPAAFSEHLAWSTHDGAYLNDLLPLPLTEDTLGRVGDHILQVQDTLGRQMLLENPSSYLRFADSTIAEPDFLSRLVARTGCGLLLDVNNVFISACNLGFAPKAYVDALPLDAVGEVHVGGHTKDQDEHGAPLLIDTHGAETSADVWTLLDHLLHQTGPRPVLVEWDTNVPDWPTLTAEAIRAQSQLHRHSDRNVA